MTCGAARLGPRTTPACFPIPRNHRVPLAILCALTFSTTTPEDAIGCATRILRTWCVQEAALRSLCYFQPSGTGCAVLGRDKPQLRDLSTGLQDINCRKILDVLGALSNAVGGACSMLCLLSDAACMRPSLFRRKPRSLRVAGVPSV